MNQNRKFCNTQIERKTPGMCCNMGKTKLDTFLKPLESLHCLLEGDHPDQDHFIHSTRK